jgi:molybdopterin converting factor small subunit
MLNINFKKRVNNRGAASGMAQIFVKLMAKGLKSTEHDKFPFETAPGATVRDLIDELCEDQPQRFKVYLGDSENRTLKRETIVIVNGMNMVARKGEKTKLSDGDLVVFMIAAVGG